MSKPTDKDPLAPIDPSTLNLVTGGTGNSSPLVSQLNGILDSIKSIRSVSKENGINPQEMMLFMMLMQRSQPTTIQVQPTPWWTQGKRHH